MVNKYVELQKTKGVVKKLKAKDTKANKLKKQAIDKETGFYNSNKGTFKLKEFDGVKSKVATMRR